MNFIDEATIDVRGGRGGNGCVAFRREKYVPRGGPSGGDGGDGGSVYLRGDVGLSTLYHLRHQRLWAAERGEHGQGSQKTGRSGEDLSVPVPLGTQVRVAGGAMLGEVLKADEGLLVARGGRGGRGNARFKSSTNRAPRRADPGGEGEERRLELELKLLADVGIIGLPNAGKSTFISVVSAARPKIADYPFTTLVPNLGVVARGPDRNPFVIADLPGLVEGAAEGAGLGIRFLRHAERCRLLLHFVDLAAGERPADEELALVEGELERFGAGLAGRPRWVVGSKAEAVDARRRGDLERAAGRRGLPYYEISSVTGLGVEALVGELEAALAAVAV